nr:C-type lectin 37Da-like [Drosophila takahashii]
MFLKFLGLCVFLGAFFLSSAYNITSNVIEGIPGNININIAPFVKIGNGYYFFERNLRGNWYAAYESCRQMEAELVAFESVEELNLVSQYLNNSEDGDFYWAAGTDLAEQHKHVWFSNAQPVSSDLWIPGEPSNDDNNERCDGLWFRYGLRGLNDAKCISTHNYICEAPQPKTGYFVVW